MFIAFVVAVAVVAVVVAVVAVGAIVAVVAVVTVKGGGTIILINTVRRVNSHDKKKRHQKNNQNVDSSI